MIWGLIEACSSFLVAFVPASVPVVDHVDLVELNHYYEARSGRHVFYQVIWYDMGKGRYEVVDWRMMKNVRLPLTEKQELQFIRGFEEGDKIPQGRWIGGHAEPVRRGDRWVSEWWDEKQRVHRKVYARVFRETWTTHDPEVEAREETPEFKRRELTRRAGTTRREGTR